MSIFKPGDSVEIGRLDPTVSFNFAGLPAYDNGKRNDFSGKSGKVESDKARTTTGEAAYLVKIPYSGEFVFCAQSELIDSRDVTLPSDDELRMLFA